MDGYSVLHTAFSKTLGLGALPCAPRHPAVYSAVWPESDVQQKYAL
jgi:hypothetical protein